MADILSGLLFVLLSGLVYATAYQLPAGRGHAPGPGFFPELAALFGMVIGVAICVRAVMALRRARGPRPHGGAESRGDVLRLVGLLAASIAYVVALRPIGFLAASFLFLAAGLLMLGERRVLLLLVVPAGLTGGVLVIFSYLLGLRLPAGTLF